MLVLLAGCPECPFACVSGIDEYLDGGSGFLLLLIFKIWIFIRLLKT